ncbi:MAG: hypothetical protein ABF868_00660 [Sporolactobacillus sp.]
MAQLVKIRECVSRYQLDLSRYARRYILLKQRRAEQWLEARGLNAARKQEKEPAGIHPGAAFYRWLYAVQLEWASQTSERRSPLPEDLLTQHWLAGLLRAVNDLAFFLYYPVLKTQQAEVQLDCLLLTGSTIWVVKPLIGEAGSVFQAQDARKWQEIVSGGRREQLNPLISLARSRHVMTALLKHAAIDMEVAGAVYAPESFIEFAQEERGVALIDQRMCGDWHRRLSEQTLLFKRSQLEAAHLLLEHCLTHADVR